MGSKLQFLKKSLKCDYALENNIETLYRHLGKLMEKIHIYIYIYCCIDQNQRLPKNGQVT